MCRCRAARCHGKRRRAQPAGDDRDRYLRQHGRSRIGAAKAESTYALCASPPSPPRMMRSERACHPPLESDRANHFAHPGDHDVRTVELGGYAIDCRDGYEAMTGARKQPGSLPRAGVPRPGAWVSTRSETARDRNHVLGMLTASSDVVRDSFSMTEREGLSTIRVGDLEVWLERGPHATIAALVRGSAPDTVRAMFHDAIEQIHSEFGRELREFDGDSTRFEPARPVLERCLVAEFTPH